jgi:exosome complex RNA-binding protein Rrp4
MIMKQIVLPGDMILEKEERLPNTYTEDGKTYAYVSGLYDSATKRIVALEGNWTPRQGDVVIGIITNAGRKGMYSLDLSHFMTGMIIDKFTKLELHKGEVVEAEVDRIENRRIVHLVRPRTLKDGVIITIGPTKVHRVIGKGNTMIKQICDATRSTIVVGENGMIWIKGGNVELATEAILEVERSAHISGLTEMIKNMLLEKR